MATSSTRVRASPARRLCLITTQPPQPAWPALTPPTWSWSGDQETQSTATTALSTRRPDTRTTPTAVTQPVAALKLSMVKSNEVAADFY